MIGSNHSAYTQYYVKLEFQKDWVTVMTYHFVPTCKLLLKLGASKGIFE